MTEYRAKLCEALMSGPKRPGDLDELILGYFGHIFPLTGTLPPYADDLGALIDEDIVTWHRADDDIVWYQLKEENHG